MVLQCIEMMNWLIPLLYNLSIRKKGRHSRTFKLSRNAIKRNFVTERKLKQLHLKNSVESLIKLSFTLKIISYANSNWKNSKRTIKFFLKDILEKSFFQDSRMTFSVSIFLFCTMVTFYSWGFWRAITIFE